MLQNQKILITGPAGQIAKPLAQFLASDNEVWGVSRFVDRAVRGDVEALGIRTVAADIGAGDLALLPADFDYVLHLAAYREPGEDFQEALRVNAEGTGFLMNHCRKAKAVLVMSSHAVYRPHTDPLHVYSESDPIGDANPPYARTYSISKIAQEAVARSCSRTFGIPTVIARMNASYGANGGRPFKDLDTVRSGGTVRPKWDPLPYSPIAQDDINAQVAPLLVAASVPALTVNWAGDEPATAQEWTAYLCELAGLPPRIETTPYPGTQVGLIADNTRRSSITGPCRYGWREGMRLAFSERYPSLRPPVDQG